MEGSPPVKDCAEGSRVSIHRSIGRIGFHFIHRRARYLRLPSPGHRTAALVQQAHDTLHLRPLLHRPLRSQLSTTPHNTSGTEHASTATPPAPIIRNRTFANLLASRSGLRAAPRDSEVPSPGMDAVSADDRRDRLWIQLRGVQLRGLSDDRAKSR